MNHACKGEGGGGKGDFLTKTWVFENSKIQLSTGKRKKEKNTKKKKRNKKLKKKCPGRSKTGLARGGLFWAELVQFDKRNQCVFGPLDFSQFSGRQKKEENTEKKRNKENIFFKNDSFFLKKKEKMKNHDEEKEK